jgi:NCS1 family nucleobase:cation symporter-1
MRPIDLSPIPPDDQTSRPVDLFLIFAGANIVVTTLQVGASLPGSFTAATALSVIAVGVIAGSALTAALAPVGSRLRVPSIVAARAALGPSGAQALAAVLFVTNFAWIALNNVIAASITAQVAGAGSTSQWAVGLGLAATAIVLGGPRAAALVNRLAVPVLALAGVVFTVAVIRSPAPAWPAGGLPARDLTLGLDVVIGYQASWLLMFADYPRFVRSARGAGVAVFLGLALSSLWFMPLGLMASTIAGSADPGAMVAAMHLGAWGALLVALAALTTNFVNIYMSALAFKSLRPAVDGRTGTLIIGGIGAALSAFSLAWLDRFAAFTLVLAGTLVPIGGILIAHFLIRRAPVDVARLYAAAPGWTGWSMPGMTAWAAGATAFLVSQPMGGTLPSLVTAMTVYLWLAGRAGRAR